MGEDKIRIALDSQKAEITEHYIYTNLAKKAGPNRKHLEKIAADELGHYNFWKKISKQEVKPAKMKIWLYTLLVNILGVTFALKLMESGEEDAQDKYKQFKNVKGINKIIRDEQEHELKIIRILKDEPLEYAGSIVLGLNDALVELTGALAGMTLALQNSKIVAIAGLVTGLAASLSMAASNYLSVKEDKESKKKPLRSAIYTGMTYLSVVIILIAPYFIFKNIFASLITTLTLAVLIIAAYTFYISVAKERKFLPQFTEMIIVSLTTAAISFLFGLLLNNWFGI